jgi:hypothetical protein
MRNYEVKLVDSSRLLADILTDDIGNDPERFNEMMQITLRDEYPVSMRAARIIALSCSNHPELIAPCVDRIILSLKDCKTDGVRRSFLKILTEIPLHFDDEQLGVLTDLAFTWLSDPAEPISVRYYSIEILQIVSRKYPEIGTELSGMLQELVDDGSSGLKAKSRKVLNYLKRIR